MRDLVVPHVSGCTYKPPYGIYRDIITTSERAYVSHAVNKLEKTFKREQYAAYNPHNQLLSKQIYYARLC